MKRFGLAPFLGAVLLLFCCMRANAQQNQVTITSQPPIPRAGEPVTLILHSPCHCPFLLNNSESTAFQRNGFTIDVESAGGCLAACIGHQVEPYHLGVLPAGVYTVRHYRSSRPTDFTIIGTFAVAEVTPIPTLSDWAMAALALMLCAAAAIHLHR